MIKIFNSVTDYDECREIALSDVNIHTQGICEFTARPYILFEHKDFPLGALRAEFDGEYWLADLN